MGPIIKGTDRPALKYLNRYVRPDITTKWHDVGIELLDVEDEPTLDAIQANYSGDVDKCTAEMLRLWLKRKPDANWNQLIEAFRTPGIRLEALASKIEGMLFKEKALVPSSRETLMLVEKLEDFAKIDKLKDENVIEAFTYLFHKLEILFSKTDIDELKSACKLRGAPLPLEFKQRIKDAQKLDDMFDVLDNPLYCNWLNVRLLKTIAKNIENQQAVELIKIYKENVDSRKVSDVKQYFSICFDQKTMSLIEVEINKSPEDLTVKEILKSCKELDKILDIYRGAASVINTSVGCLKITIVIPLHCTLHAFKMAQRNALKLRQFHIQYLKIESLPKVFALNYPDNENTVVSLSSTIPISSNPSQVVNHYYTYLEGHMDADSVSHMMHYKHLITDDDCEAITAAPNDHKMNTVILQYVRAMNVNELITFCNVLKSIETQKNIGDCLSTALETVLKNSSVDSKDQTADNEDMSKIHLMFFDLVDKLILLLIKAEKLRFDLFNFCRDLDACDSIPLFTAKSLKSFSNCKSVFCFKIFLVPFITWLDHSILNELVTASGSDTAKQLLDQFDCRIDKSKSVTSYPIPTPNQLMIPLDDSEYTILAVRSYNCHNDITLYEIEEIKFLMTSTLKVSNHVFQLLAIHNKTNYLYWMIPRSIASFIQCSLKSSHELLQNGLIISVLPDGLFAGENVYSVQEKLKGPFSLLYSQIYDNNTEEDLRDIQITILIKKNQHDFQEHHRSFRETVSCLKTDKNALEEQLQDLTSKLQVQLNLKNKSEKLSEKMTNIRLENAKLKRESERLNLELDTSKAKNDALNAYNKQLLFELQKMIGKEAKLKRESERLNLELDTSKAKNDALNADNKQLQFELQKMIGKERSLPAEQDKEYEAAVLFDQAKKREEEASENTGEDEFEVRNKRVKELRIYFVKKFTSESFDDTHESKISVAFKLSDGKNIQFSFSPTSTIKEMYQYFFSKEDQYPFTLFTMKPRQELPLSKGSDFLTDYPVKDALVIMEWSDEDVDNFLNKLDECHQDKIIEMADTRCVVRLDMPSNERPHMKGLNRYLTEYSVFWRSIGLKLGLQSSVINIIEADHDHQRECFRAMLQRWLQQDVQATWHKLELAITNAKREFYGYDALDARALTINCGKGMVKDAVFAEAKKAICCIKSPSMTGYGFVGYVKCSEGRYSTVLVTNNHVIKTFDDAMGSRIIFENVFPDRNITLRGSEICVRNSFWCSPLNELDYTLVEIDEDKLVDSKTNRSLDISPMQLIRPADIKEGDQIYVIQHPRGKQLAFLSSDSIVLDPLLLYQCTTNLGSSGSPVLKEVDGELNVVALHRGGREANVNWFGYNCGTLMREILNHLNGRPVPPLPTNNTVQETLRRNQK